MEEGEGIRGTTLMLDLLRVQEGRLILMVVVRARELSLPPFLPRYPSLGSRCARSYR